MGDINATIKDFQNRKLEPISKWWIVGATPYHKAYGAACDAFLDTIEHTGQLGIIKDRGAGA